MIAEILHIGSIHQLSESKYDSQRPFIQFSMKTGIDSKAAYHDYIMGGNLAKMFLGKLSVGSLVTVMGSASKSSIGGTTYISWSVDNFQLDSIHSPQDHDAPNHCRVSIKGHVYNIKMSQQITTFGVGTKPRNSNDLIFFNVRMSSTDFQPLSIKNKDRIFANIHLETRHLNQETFKNWHCDLIFKIP